jgi:hypothetical protein
MRSDFRPIRGRLLPENRPSGAALLRLIDIPRIHYAKKRPPPAPPRSTGQGRIRGYEQRLNYVPGFPIDRRRGQGAC